MTILITSNARRHVINNGIAEIASQIVIDDRGGERGRERDEERG